MSNKTSDHVKPCNIGQSEAHNRRSRDYLARINENKIYIRRDLISQNQSWVSDQMRDRDLQQYLDDIARMVKEKTGRAMQTKERKVVNKKTGRVKTISGSSPLRESVVVCKRDTTLAQLRQYCNLCHERFGITAIQIHIHRDEGHYEVPGDKNTWKPNYHAHIIWDWMDHETGKSCKLNAADMSAMQDMIAECLVMERGASKAETGKEHLERNDFIIQKQESKKKQLQEETNKVLTTLDSYSKAANIKQEDLIVPVLGVDNLVGDAWKHIVEELNKPIPTFNQKEWREERKKGIKQILTDMQTQLMKAKNIQKDEALRLGKSLYQKAMKEVNAIIKENQKLQKQNERLTHENEALKTKIKSIDASAIEKLRKTKDAEINELQKQLDKAERQAVLSDNAASRERQRADKAESQVQEMMDIPEIKELWEDIQRNKKDFMKQIDRWIKDGVAAIREYAEGKSNDFQPEQGNAVAWGIIAEAFRCGLDPTDPKQRKMAAAYLLERMSWTGMSSFKADLTATRTRQLCDAMTVSKDLMANLLLAAGGRGGIGTGGGGSTSELTNWDGTKKKTGWGV